MTTDFLIAFFASCIGAISGIGGGIIIKPVMDAVTPYTLSQINFMSGCTVLCMSSASVLLNFLATRKNDGHQSSVPKTTIFLGLGAAIGGICGKSLFDLMLSGFAKQNAITIIQNVILIAINVLILCVMLFMGHAGFQKHKKNENKNKADSPVKTVIIGFLLGSISSFLGIGGGPLNLLALAFFYSMPPKSSAINSLYIILISQLFSLISMFFTGFPTVALTPLALMCAGGVLGGIVGRFIAKLIRSVSVTRVYISVLVFVILICVTSIYRSLC